VVGRNYRIELKNNLDSHMREKTFGILLFTGTIIFSSGSSWIKRLSRFVSMAGARTKSLFGFSKSTLSGELIYPDVIMTWHLVKSKNYAVGSQSSFACELEVINDSDGEITLCWIGFDGSLQNFRPINDGSIKDGSVANSHLEFTECGHAFACLKSTRAKPKFIENVNSEVILVKATHR